MRIFRINHPDDGYTYRGTLAEAHTDAKELQPRNEIRIEQLDVDTDKAGVILALNKVPVITVEKTWSLTQRGGLNSIANGE